MRIAVFTNQFPSRVSTFFARDMRGLLDAGIEIDIFPIYPLDPILWRYVPDILGENVLTRDKVYNISFAQTLRSARPWPFGKLLTFLRDTAAVSASTAGFGAGPLAKNAYVFLKAWAWAHQHSENYDHVLAYWGNYAATCAYIFHRLLDKRVPFSMFLHAGMDLYQNQIYLRQKLLYADNIIVVCKFNRQFIYDHFTDIFEMVSNKVHVYHLGLDFAEFPYEPEGRPPRKILAVGSLENYKGFDYLLHATHELSCRGIDIEVELVGDGECANSLRALANQLKIGERVRFWGWLGFDEVQNIMKQVTMLVHPSRPIKDIVGDGVPTVIKEAMALGTPVVASNVAGIPELLDDGRCGILVPSMDVKALADAIETLVTNASLRQSYAEAARRYAEETFDLWRNGQVLAELLRSTSRLELRNSI